MEKRKSDINTRKSVDVPLVSEFIDTLHETVHGNLISVKKYRPHTARIVYQYADLPVTPNDVGYGTQTKSR